MRYKVGENAIGALEDEVGEHLDRGTLLGVEPKHVNPRGTVHADQYICISIILRDQLRE